MHGRREQLEEKGWRGVGKSVWWEVKDGGEGGMENCAEG